MNRWNAGVRPTPPTPLGQRAPAPAPVRLPEPVSILRPEACAPKPLPSPRRQAVRFAAPSSGFTDASVRPLLLPQVVAAPANERDAAREAAYKRAGATPHVPAALGRRTARPEAGRSAHDALAVPRHGGVLFPRLSPARPLVQPAVPVPHVSPAAAPRPERLYPGCYRPVKLERQASAVPTSPTIFEENDDVSPDAVGHAL